MLILSSLLFSHTDWAAQQPGLLINCGVTRKKTRMSHSDREDKEGTMKCKAINLLQTQMRHFNPHIEPQHTYRNLLSRLTKEEMTKPCCLSRFSHFFFWGTVVDFCITQLNIHFNSSYIFPDQRFAEYLYLRTVHQIPLFSKTFKTQADNVLLVQKGLTGLWVLVL